MNGNIYRNPVDAIFGAIYHALGSDIVLNQEILDSLILMESTIVCKYGLGTRITVLIVLGEFVYTGYSEYFSE